MVTLRYVSLAAALACAAAGARVDPNALSVHPFAGQRGTSFTVTVRGNGLREASSIWTGKTGVSFRVEGAEAESAKSKTDLVKVRVDVAADAVPGAYPFRLVTPSGVSNVLPLLVTEAPVIAEPAGLHETPETAIPVTALPSLFTGRIGKRGETDYYVLEAKAGESVTFQVISGLPSIGAPGGNARGFDPSIHVFEPAGSWFDSKRLKRIGFNDEPMWVLGELTDAYLVQKFAKDGRYYLRVEAFSGQGGADYSYHLRVLPGVVPADSPKPRAEWSERAYKRRLSADRLNELAARGGKKGSAKAIESYSAAGFKFPGTIEGAIAKPGESHRAAFHLDGPKDIAIEIEAPELEPPLFTPIVRLLNAKGDEVATNIFAGRGLCTGALTKSLSAKTIVPIRDAGDYTLEIRDTTADLGEPGFQYRVQVRPQVPHVGNVKIDEDRINIAPGEAKNIRVTFDREEDYRGAIAVAVESLPAGVHSLAGADFEPDKDPPRALGKRERYVPRTERAVAVLMAAEDAALTSNPVKAKFVVRPMVDGKPGVVIAEKEVLITVVKP